MQFYSQLLSAWDENFILKCILCHIHLLVVRIHEQPYLENGKV
jgi:hypothetical protein